MTILRAMTLAVFALGLSAPVFSTGARADGIDPPVVPMALTNLWGSFFSRIERGSAMVRPFRRGIFNRVGLNVGAPLASAQVQPEGLQARVAVLLKP